MDREDVWRTIETERLAVADLFDDLSEDEWQHLSLCDGWTVRDIAAHLTMAALVNNWAVMVEFARAPGNFNRMIRDSARRRATRPVDQLVADIRLIAGSRRLAPTTTYLEPMADLLVHTQDIVIPLGREYEMPREAARTATTRMWEKAFPFYAKKKLHGLRLTATDIEWTAGEGAEVHGPISAMLMLVTGRPAAVEQLSGDGITELSTRMSVSANN